MLADKYWTTQIERKTVIRPVHFKTLGPVQKEEIMKKQDTAFLVTAAMFTALTFVATYIIRFPTPTMGYVNVGDCFVILSGIFLGPAFGALAGGLGSALSDLVGGYSLFVPGTFVIKALMALVAALLFRALKKRPVAAVLVSGIASEAIMVTGYFGYNILLTSLSGNADVSLAAAAASSAAEIPFNLVQGSIGIVLAIVLQPLVHRILQKTLSGVRFAA